MSIVIDKKIIFSNAFSQRMLRGNCSVRFEDITKEQFEHYKEMPHKSIMGHEDTAKKLGFEFNREFIFMDEDTLLIIAEMDNTIRCEEGATELPEYKFKFKKAFLI